MSGSPTRLFEYVQYFPYLTEVISDENSIHRTLPTISVDWIKLHSDEIKERNERFIEYLMKQSEEYDIDNDDITRGDD